MLSTSLDTFCLPVILPFYNWTLAFMRYPDFLQLQKEKRHEHAHLLLVNPAEDLLLCSHICSFGLLPGGSHSDVLLHTYWRRSGAPPEIRAVVDKEAALKNK